MSELPKFCEDDKSLSETVIVYDESLDDRDFGYYDFKDDTWNVLGDFQMKLVCWSYPEMPTEEELKGFEPVLTSIHKKERK